MPPAAVTPLRHGLREDARPLPWRWGLLCPWAVVRRVLHLLPVATVFCSRGTTEKDRAWDNRPTRRKKKRKKKKLPRGRFSRGRARRRWQWRASDWSFWFRAVFLSIVGPELPGLMVGMDSCGFAGYDAPRVLFPSGVARARILCILPVIDQKDSSHRALVVHLASGVCKVGFYW